MDKGFETLLAPGEELRWSGQPEPGLLVPSDLLVIPFSLLWFAGVFFGIGSALLTALRDGDSNVIVLLPVGLLFMVAGLYVTVGRFLYKAWRKQNTYYAVTNRRVIIRFRDEMESLDLKAMPTLTCAVNHRSGVGTLRFGPLPFRARVIPQDWHPGFFGRGTQVPSFVDIAGAQQVFDLIQELR